MGLQRFLRKSPLSGVPNALISKSITWLRSDGISACTVAAASRRAFNALFLVLVPRQMCCRLSIAAYMVIRVDPLTTGTLTGCLTTALAPAYQLMSCLSRHFPETPSGRAEREWSLPSSGTPSSWTPYPHPVLPSVYRLSSVIPPAPYPLHHSPHDLLFVQSSQRAPRSTGYWSGAIIPFLRRPYPRQTNTTTV
jgi:hypothetical protein